MIAYRTWNVTDGGVLSAVAVQESWSRAEIAAVCSGRKSSRRFHMPPEPGCRCGIYGWKRPVNPAFINQWSRRPAREIAVGVVLLWGRMCDGPAMTGYRAQYARMVAVVPDAAGRLDLARYPTARVYPDLLTMYGDWDVSPELGWARDADA